MAIYIIKQGRPETKECPLPYIISQIHKYFLIFFHIKQSPVKTFTVHVKS